MSNIEEINASKTPYVQSVDELVDNDKYLEGLIEDIGFNENEVEYIYNILGLENKFVEDLELGNSVSTYSDWEFFTDESGYSIWKYPVSNYAHDSENQMFLNNNILLYRGVADASSQTYFDKVYGYNTNDATPTYEDLTMEVQNEGSKDTIISTTDDYLYVGLDSKFNKITFELSSTGVGLNLELKYYQDVATPTWSTVSGITDDTNNLTQNGYISFDEPSDWGKATINGVEKYWLRIDTTDIVISPPQVQTITLGDSVEDKLLLNGSEIMNEHWAWCYYSGHVYVTIKNTHTSTSYEGKYYITSSSSEANLKNYFISNNTYKMNHLKNTYNNALSFDYGIDDTIDIDLRNNTGDNALEALKISAGEGNTTSEFVLGHNNNDDVVDTFVFKYLDNSAIPTKQFANVKAADFQIGDLIFNNDLYFTEKDDGLVLKNQNDEPILEIRSNGDYKFYGNEIS